MRKSYKKIAAVLAIMILALAMTSTSFAENVTKNLKAYYRNITVYRNGAKVNFSNEPFILDDGAGGTTYVPLRDVSAMLGKEVKWDGTNYRIDVNDGPADANTVMLQTKVVQQEIEITKLKNEVADLKAQLDAKKNDPETKKKDSLKNISTVKEMQTYIQDNYETKDKYIDFDITVSGSKSNVTVAIEIASKDKDSSDEYKTWKSSDKKSFAQDIVDDIIEALDSSKVSGYYRDNYRSGSKESFSVSSKGVVSMGSTSGGSSGRLSYVEEDIEDDYYNDIYSISIYEDSNGDLEIEIDAVYKLSNSRLKSIINSILRHNDVDSSAYIDGEVYVDGVWYDDFDEDGYL